MNRQRVVRQNSILSLLYLTKLQMPQPICCIRHVTTYVKYARSLRNEIDFNVSTHSSLVKDSRSCHMHFHISQVQAAVLESEA